MAVDIFKIGIERLKNEQAEAGASGSEQNSEFKRVLDVLICGSPKSGKSTFVNRFLDRTQNADPTFGLCYKFATRTRVNTKELANLWELGNGGLMAQLIPNCVNERNISGVSAILFLNLIEPQTQVFLLSVLYPLFPFVCLLTRRVLNQPQNRKPYQKYTPFEAILRPLLGVIKEQIDTAKVKASGAFVMMASNTLDGCYPIGIPIAIVGSHYDQFQNFDTEKKRNIIRLLRFLAHINGASLQMYSIYQDPLVSRGKTLLSQFGFDAPPNKTVSLDIHKPVFVPSCVDSLDEIGPLIEGRSRPVVSSYDEGMEQFYSALNELFKQEPDTQHTALSATEEDSKQFAEPLLDTAIAERYRELEFIIRENRTRSQPQL